MCREKFVPDEARLSYGMWGGHSWKVYHLRCADYDTSMNPDSRAEWVSWKLRQLEETNGQELASLRGRTLALYRAVLDLMRQLGVAPEDLEDFEAEYRLKDVGVAGGDSGAVPQGGA